MGIDIEKKIMIIIRKISKIQEYNKILDMTNQVFEKRLNQIQESLQRIEKKLEKE